jgi:hypothetical protein
MTTRGNEWHAQTLRNLLRSITLAGKRERDGVLYDGQWVAIFDLGRRAQLRKALERNSHGVETKAKSLLTGIAHCGVCERRLNMVTQTERSGKVTRKYACVKKPGTKACGALAIVMDPTDELVTGLLFQHVAASSTVSEDHTADVAALKEELDGINKRQDSLAREHYLRQQLTESQYTEIASELAAMADDVRARLAAIEGEPTAMDPGADLPGWWASASLTEKRELLRTYIADVVVRSAAHKGGNVYRPERVEVLWR